MKQHPVHIAILLLVAVILSAVLAAGMGYMPIGAKDVVVSVLSSIGGDVPESIDPLITTVVLDIRLPRIIAAITIGGILAVSGAVFQGILLNPLADPYTLGISSGAAFGASVALVFAIIGLHIPTFLTIPLFAFLGAVATLAVVISLASIDKKLSSTSLILSGVIVAAILSAAIGFLKFIADEQVGVIIFWLMGSLSGVTWQNLAILLPVGLFGVIFSICYGRDLNIMAMGHKSADTMGVDTIKVRKLLLVVCSLMTAISVSVAGIIGFVGLIIPHLLRFVIGPDNRWLIPLSFLAGAILLLIADTVTRAILPVEVPIGILTALLGGPFFCVIFKKNLTSRN